MDLLGYSLQTFGCKVNTYDAGLLQKRLAGQGYRLEDRFEKAQVHIINTCAVTAEATKEAVRTARRIKRKLPKSVVVMTGCSAQVDTEILTGEDAVDLVVANSHKGQIEEIILKFLSSREESPRLFKSNIFKKEDLEAGGGEEEEHTRSFLKIQDGCNSFCTFCVIPFARGKSRSLSPAQLIEKIRELEERGVREVVLTGVHIGDYESDSGIRLEGLVSEILEKTSMPRLRLSSLEPPELTPELVALYKASDRLCQHFHLSIQSGESRVLKAMKRSYNADSVEHAFLEISSELPGSYVGMDVIAGFPSESDEEFARTYDLLARSPWTRMHVFPYSSRPKTVAEKMDGHLPQAVIKTRAQALRSLSEERLGLSAAAQVGKMKKVLVLRGGGGLSRDYWNVQFLPEHTSLVSGQEYEVIIQSFDAQTGTLFA